MAATQTQVKMSSPTNNKNKRNKNTPKGNKEKMKTVSPVSRWHLDFVPLPLVLVVLVCSGILWILSFRDFMATGNPILGEEDLKMLLFQKSTEFYDDSKGWKAKAGGLSIIESVTTDANNMGGLFVRKINGVAGVIVHSQKLIPLLFQTNDFEWKLGHFHPLLVTSMLGNIAIAVFYGTYLEDLEAAKANKFALGVIGLLVFETLVMFFYFVSSIQLVKRWTAAQPSVALPPGKTPSSIVNRIAMRTITIVSGFMALMALRDLFFPGQIIPFLPRDDIYLEWTNSFLHSPPFGSPEQQEGQFASVFYIGDKFLSQSLALYLLINCMHKFTTAYFIRLGRSSQGLIKCKQVWRVQASGNLLLLFVMRLFALASKSASFDLRWHLMSIAYETIILGLYAFF